VSATVIDIGTAARAPEKPKRPALQPRVRVRSSSLIATLLLPLIRRDNHVGEEGIVVLTEPARDGKGSRFWVLFENPATGRASIFAYLKADLEFL